jgi:hypothetical protein
MQLLSIVVPVLVAIVVSSVLDKSELFVHRDVVNRGPAQKHDAQA